MMYDIQDGLDFAITRHGDSNYSRRGLLGFIFRRKVGGCRGSPRRLPA